MGKPATQAKKPVKASNCAKAARRQLKVCTLVSFKFVAYLALATWCNVKGLWNWTYEPHGLQCSHKPRGAKYNRTRLKVLTFTAPKTGTTSLAHLLGELFENSYHSEDFSMHIWSTLADRHWQKPENGGSLWPWSRLTTSAAPAYMGHSFLHRPEFGSDRRVHDALSLPELAEAIESCNVDAFTPDGFERLFWDLYEISPEAKVLMLNWRSFEDVLRSSDNFLFERGLLGFFVGLVNEGIHFLPWGALVFPLLDALSGTLTNFLTRGECIYRKHGPAVLLWIHAMSERRVTQHWWSGFGFMPPWKDEAVPPDMADYEEHWARGKRRIPKDRLFEVNMKKHSPADICKMLGITDKPICKDTGRIKAIQPHLVPYITSKISYLMVFPVWLFIHWVNYALLWGTLDWLFGGIVLFLRRHHASSKAKKA